METRSSNAASAPDSGVRMLLASYWKLALLLQIVVTNLAVMIDSHECMQRLRPPTSRGCRCTTGTARARRRRRPTPPGAGGGVDDGPPRRWNLIEHAGVRRHRGSRHAGGPPGRAH